MANGALAGLKVIDLTQYVAGPYCTKMLADYGAEVIKVEKPVVGDKARKAGPCWNDLTNDQTSALFLYLNTNKKSITLNLKEPEGRMLFTALVETADVLVESYRPRVMPALGIDYGVLEQINPALVMTSISNFGQTGPYSDYKASHVVECALAGWSYCGGEEDREPLQAAGLQGFFVAGLCAANGTLTAMHHRWRTGVGQHVDVSIMEAMLPLTTHVTVDYSFLRRIRRRAGNYLLPGYGFIVRCKDGYLGVNTLTSEHWELLCQFVGMPDMLEDSRFQGPYGRLEYCREISALIAPWFLDKSRDEVFHSAKEWRIPIGLVLSPGEVVGAAQFRERGLFVEVAHPGRGGVSVPAAPFKMPESPWQMTRGVPSLGEHNREVYADLGYDAADLRRLSERGVI